MAVTTSCKGRATTDYRERAALKSAMAAETGD